MTMQFKQNTSLQLLLNYRLTNEVTRLFNQTKKKISRLSKNIDWTKNFSSKFGRPSFDVIQKNN